MLVTKSEFSRRLGISKARVSQYVGQGLPVDASGKIDEAIGRAWVKANIASEPSRLNTKRSARRARGKAAKATPPVRTEQDALTAVTLVKRVLEQDSTGKPEGVDLSMARTAESILKSRERELKLAERRKELVPIADVRAHVSKAFTGFKMTMQRIPVRHAGAIAAALGVDAGKLEKLLDAAIRSELEALSAPVVRT